MTKYTIKCTDCGTKKIYSSRTQRGLHEKAREDGWAISKDYQNKWCPNCAVLHRNTGRGGVRPFIQTKLDV